MSTSNIGEALRTVFNRKNRKLPYTISSHEEYMNVACKIVTLIQSMEEDKRHIEQAPVPKNIIALVDIRDTYCELIELVNYNQDYIYNTSSTIEGMVKQLQDAVDIFDSTLRVMLEKVS